MNEKIYEYNWKGIILQWAVQCRLVKEEFFGLKAINIENCCQKLLSGLHRNISNGDLLGFLSENYPKFVVQMDDRGFLDQKDNINIYSLLLHFVCVKYPEIAIYEIRKRLPRQSQRSIASFLIVLGDCTAIDRENLIYAIRTAAVKNADPTSDSPDQVVESPNAGAPCSSANQTHEEVSEELAASQLKNLNTSSNLDIEEVQFELIAAKVNKLEEEKQDLEKKLCFISYAHSTEATHSDVMENELQTIKSAKEEMEINLKQQLEESQCQLKLYEEEVVQLKIAARENNVNLKLAYKEKTICAEKAIVDLENTIMYLEDTIKEADSRMMMMYHTNAKLEQQLEECVKEKEATENELSELQTQFAVKVEQLENNVDELFYQNRKLHEEFLRSISTYESLNEKFTEFGSTVEKLRCKVLQNVRSETKVIETLEKSEVPSSQPKQTVEKETQELKNLQAAYNIQKTELEQSIVERNRLEVDISCLKVKIHQQQEERKAALLSSMEQSVACANEVQVLTKRCTKDHLAFKQKESELQEHTLQKTLEDHLKQQLNSKNLAEKDGLRVKKQTINAELDIGDVNVSQLLESNEALKMENKQLKACASGAKEKLDKLESILQFKKGQINELTSSLETMEKANVRMYHEIGALNAQLELLRKSRYD